MTNTSVNPALEILGQPLKPATDWFIGKIEATIGGNSILARAKTVAPYVASCCIICLTLGSLAAICPTTYPLLYVAATVARTYADVSTTVVLVSSLVYLTGFVTRKDLGMGMLTDMTKSFTDRLIDQVAAVVGSGRVTERMKEMLPYVASCCVISLAATCFAGAVSHHYPLIHLIANIARTYTNAYTTVTCMSVPVYLVGFTAYVYSANAVSTVQSGCSCIMKKVSGVYHRVFG